MTEQQYNLKPELFYHVPKHNSDILGASADRAGGLFLPFPPLHPWPTDAG